MTDQVSNDEIKQDKNRATVALSTSETVSRYGSANAEFVKGYTGVDNELGIKLHDGLKKISEQGKGLAQKAGTSAEILVTSQNNAESKINKSDTKEIRTDDMSRQFGTNHPIADRVIFNGGEVTYTQMKFEGDPKSLVSKIVSDDGEYAKYLDPKDVCEKRMSKHLAHAEKAELKAKKADLAGNSEKAAEHRQNAIDLRKRAESNQKIGDAENIKLEVPTEQVEEIKQICRDRASSCLEEAMKAEDQALQYEQQGNMEAAAKSRSKALAKRQEAARCKKLAENVSDSGLTQEEANLAASQPLKVTAISIMRTSHRAGVEGAKIGSIVGGSISLLTNAFAVAQEKKQLGEAAKDVVLDTGKAAVVSYATTATGAAIKGVMQQSSKQSVRMLAGTNAPALAVNVVLSLGSSVKRYVNNEITAAQLLEEIGEKGAGMLSSGMMAGLGQLVIPIPFVGAAVGGMIGYTLSSMFYQSALDAGRQADTSNANLVRIREIETAARVEIEHQRDALYTFMQTEFPQLQQETAELFACIDHHDPQDTDTFAAAINSYAELMGAQLQFKNQMEFDDFMLNSDEPLQLNIPPRV